MRPQPGATSGPLPQTGAERRPPGEPRRSGPREGKNQPVSFFPIEAAWIYSFKQPIVAWPAYDDGNMYLAFETGVMALAISRTVGTPTWSAPGVEAKFPLQADGERVYAAVGDAVQALDAKTGKSLWLHPAGGQLAAAPVARAGWLLLPLENGDIRALRGETGDEVWKLSLGAAVRIEPLIDGARVYFSPENNKLVAVDLVSGKVLWTQDQGAVANAVAAFKDGVFVGTTGRMFYALSDKDGSVRWKWRVGADTIGHPMFSDDHVFVASLDNTIRAFKLDKGAQEWRQPMDFRPRPGALRIDQTIIVAGFSPVLRGYRTDNGKAAGAFTVPVAAQAEVAAPLHYVQAPFFLDDMIVVVTLEGDVAAVRRVGIPAAVPPTVAPGTPASTDWTPAGSTAPSAAATVSTASATPTAPPAPSPAPPSSPPLP
jgi:outer membrane protein assembly factor BamB